MTEDDAATEELAERIAARGHDALIERLRTAYAEAAKTHSDVVVMDADRIEALVQRSAERADGLQWRRALANVACDELGIGLIEALHHPAVARAQQLVGAPSYEESLAELTHRPVPPPLDPIEPVADVAPVAPVDAAAPVDDAAPIDDDAPPEPPDVSAETAAEESAAPAPEPEATPEPEPDTMSEAETASEPEAVEDEDEDEDEDDLDQSVDVPAAANGEPEALRVTAIHLTGVANLPVSEGVDLRLSGDGLDIMRGEDEILGRLSWQDIDALEVPVLRGRRRRRGGGARLIVRTRQGDASFEVPAFSGEELRERTDPIVARFSAG